VRQDDPQWFEIVKWTHFAMLDAEELGVSSKTIDAALTSKKPDVKRLVGTDGNFGEQIGLTRDWVVRIVRAVGNYGESFERNVGSKSNLGIPRNLNQLWSAGGIQYAPPIR
jgi:general L-amino acid transport system substrate-binding protein